MSWLIIISLTAQVVYFSSKYMYKSDEPEDMLRRVFVFLKNYHGPLTLIILGTLTNIEESIEQNFLAQNCDSFLTHQFKYVFCLLKRNVSSIRFF